MFFKDDIVVITCKYPAGTTVNVCGRIGIITNIDKDGYINVKDIRGDNYLYIASEMRDANIEEVCDAFIKLVKERI